MKPEFDDYATCSETYATLRLYHATQTPDVVTAALAIEPSETQRHGDTYTASNTTRTKIINGWFLGSKEHVSSFDVAKHITHILDSLNGKEDMLHSLLADGWRADIACRWDSAFGHGGPTLNPELLARLAKLGVEIWFDIYFHGAYELLEKEKNAFGGR